MPKLDITDEYLHTIISEVAPLVSQVTNWDLKLPTLRVRALPKDQGYEEILLGRLQGIDVGSWRDMMPDFLERLLEYMIESNVLAAYMPGAGEILVVRENVDDSNLDGLKLILTHELTHRAQHMAHGEIFKRLDQLMQQAFSLIQAPGNNLQAIQQIFAQIQPMMTTLESHAAYVQGMIRQKYLPGAQIEKHFNLATLLLRLIAAPKVAQYTDGLPQIAGAVQAGNLDALFTQLDG